MGALVVRVDTELDPPLAECPPGLDCGLHQTPSEAIVALTWDQSDAEHADVGHRLTSWGRDIAPTDDPGRFIDDHELRIALLDVAQTEGAGHLERRRIEECEVAALPDDDRQGRMEAGEVGLADLADGKGNC